ncbi:MAG: PilZ domain-containing protein [Spirochaetales bacterium]|nr:PilZ domain-containing protein [Spirochaetales bacterium]
MYGVEKRQQERYSLKAPVHVKKEDGTNHTVDGVLTRDISSKGVYIDSNGISLEPGERVQLEVTLTIDKLRELFNCSEKIILKVEGEVVRSVGEGLAVEFTKKYSIFPEILKTV